MDPLIDSVPFRTSVMSAASIGGPSKNVPSYRLSGVRSAARLNWTSNPLSVGVNPFVTTRKVLALTVTSKTGIWPLESPGLLSNTSTVTVNVPVPV